MSKRSNRGIRQFTSPPSVPQPAQIDLRMDYGTSPDKVVLQFNRSVSNIQLTEEQAERHIECCQDVLGKLRERKKGIRP